jgi:N-acyl-D-amino-acid deacylase
MERRTLTRLLLKDGVVIDGLGGAGRPGDVLIEDDTVLGILTPGEHASADRVIELDGLAVAPGFIDMHSHSDLQVLAEPFHPAKISQGITTEVVGQDGLSYAPVDDATLEQLRDRLRGWNGDPDLAWDWRSVSEYLARLDGNIAVNVAYLAPHGTIRMLVMGDEDRQASRAELARMREVLRAALVEGAVGLSAGLTYVPGAFAETNELVALCEVVARLGGYFCPHHRNYGSAAIEAYRECVEVARRSGVALHYAHAHLSFPPNEHRIAELGAIFDQAVADGVDLSLDSYPYLAGMTTLLSQLPSWAQTGDQAALRTRLSDPEARARIADALDVTGSDGHQGLTVQWDSVVVVGVPGAPQLVWIVGLPFLEAARRAQKAPSEFCLDVLLATGFAAPCVIFMGYEHNVRAIMRRPFHTVGSDGILVGDRPHPRAWGTFPRMLQTYVREAGVLTLEECVRHMTSAPADRLGQPDLGRILPGAKADLVVFDPSTVGTEADYEQPRRRAVGIHRTFVAGRPLLEEGGQINHCLNGRVLHRKG